MSHDTHMNGLVGCVNESMSHTHTHTRTHTHTLSLSHTHTYTHTNTHTHTHRCEQPAKRKGSVDQGCTKQLPRQNTSIAPTSLGKCEGFVGAHSRLSNRCVC